MTGQKKRTAAICITVILLITAAVIFRWMGFAGISDVAPDYIRPAIYIGLFSAWGVSVRNRIIQPQIRRYLTGVAVLMVFWILARTAKYSIVPPELEPDLPRYLWYLYYLPIIFIPLLGVLIALTLGKSDEYRLPKTATLLFIPAALLFLLTATNDFHNIVFTFPEGEPHTAENGSHAAGYWLVVCWVLGCTLTALTVMLLKCRLPRSKKILLLPFFPVAAAVIYGITYLLKLPWVRIIAGDMTVAFCLLIAAVFESCIQCGLIRSNTHYRELFDASKTGMMITDREYNVILSSKGAQGVSKEILRSAENGSVTLPNGFRISSAPIRGGRAVWAEDMSPLLAVLEELSDVKESLTDSNELLSEEYALKEKEARIAELDRLYDIIGRDTSGQIELMVKLIDAFESTASEEERVKLLGKMTVIGAYLKRRSNLILISDKELFLEARELQLAFSESMDNLELYGVSCGYKSDIGEKIPAGIVMKSYDFFEQIVELSIDCITCITAIAEKKEKAYSVTVNTDSDADLSVLASDNVMAVRDEDGEWQLVLTLSKEADYEGF